MRHLQKSGWILTALLAIHTGSAHATETPDNTPYGNPGGPAVSASLSTEQRLQRLERVVQGRLFMDMTQQMDQMRREVTELREMLENQERQINQMQQRQRNLYLDMDRRLHNLETGGATTTPGSSMLLPEQQTAEPDAPSPMVAPPAQVEAPPVEAPLPEAAAPASDDTLLSEPEPEPLAMPQTGENQEEAAYSNAFNLLKEGRYEQAIGAFKAYLQRYPSGQYASNAQYWLGEANYVSRDYQTALQEFQRIINDFPASNKRQDAELKIAYTYYELRDWPAARKALENIIRTYPNSPVAKLAENRLHRMQREGR